MLLIPIDLFRYNLNPPSNLLQVAMLIFIQSVNCDEILILIGAQDDGGGQVTILKRKSTRSNQCRVYVTLSTVSHVHLH
jgi:hypothetical protein